MKDVYEVGKRIVELIEKKKIVKVDVLDVHEITPLADLFVIAVASNTRQTQAIADDLEELLQSLEVTVQKEGYRTANWILLDCGPIIVHILEEEHAAFYGLERLWKDAPKASFQQAVQ